MCIERESGLETGRKTDINTDRWNGRDRDAYIQIVRKFERQTHREVERQTI